MQMFYFQLDKKLGHWDIAVRELAGCALRELTPVSPDLVLTSVLPRMVDLASTGATDLFLRHGAVGGVGYVVHALSKVAEKEGKSLEEYLGEELKLTIGLSLWA